METLSQDALKYRKELLAFLRENKPSQASNAKKRDERTSTSIHELIEKHPNPTRWLKHFKDELLPFWEKDGVEMKNHLFRSYLTHEGKYLSANTEEWPDIFKDALILEETKGLFIAEDGTPYYTKNFVRMHARQTFAYGVAYHVTGDEKYFRLCEKAAMELMNLVDDSGSMYTLQEEDSGKWIKNKSERTSQDLAYGMTGIAIYYYLTHDSSALEKILLLKEFIFNKYFDAGKDLFTWLPTSAEGDSSVELVAHLDQLYAYMLWLMPALPQPYKDEWKKDMKHIAHIMVTRFYSDVYGIFWGGAASPSMKELGTNHTDFGHSVKCMWVIYQVGVWTDDTFLVSFAKEKIHLILQNAYDKQTGAWNRRFNVDETIDTDKEWWGLAELNQATAMLALTDPSYLKYLNTSYEFWFRNMVDHDNHEIWHMLRDKNKGDKNKEPQYQPVKEYPKAHCWKNGLHSFEHALFAYMTASQIKGEEFHLYYAFESIKDVTYQQVSPYTFKGNISDKRDEGDIANTINCVKRRKIKVSFDSLH